jgi:hypothetical protein
MRYAVTFSTRSASAKLMIHDGACVNARKKPGRNAVQLPEGTTYADALKWAADAAAEVGRKSDCCKCVNAKGPACLRDIFSL